MDKKYLNPVAGVNGQKSFYKKAFVTTDADGDQYLTSYKTVVAMKIKGRFYRCWNGYSRTTMEHVKAFFGRNISKKEWDEMDVIDPDTGELIVTGKESKDVQYRVVATSGFATFVPQARFANEEEAESLRERLCHGPWVAWVE